MKDSSVSALTVSPQEVASVRRYPVDWIVGVGLALLIGVVGWFLFFPDGVPLFGSVSQSEDFVRSTGVLTIAYHEPLLSYEPTLSDLTTRSYLINTYEPLIRFDKNLNLEPALALSWGMLSDDTWQFKLRPNVTFHDGSAFTADDVVESVDRAKRLSGSQLTTLVASVDTVEVVDALTVRFITSAADPTLANKLTLVPMVPAETRVVVDRPIGTGPYQFDAAEAGVWTFSRYQHYWGDVPAFPTLRLVAVSDKFERYEAFLRGDFDVLAQVPPVFVNSLLDQGYSIASQPSLEVSFLLFNWQHANSSLRHREFRQALRLLVDPEATARLTGGFARPIGQFVSRGIYGYNPKVDIPPYSPETAQALVSALGRSLRLQLDLPEGMESLGDYWVQQLEPLGVSVTTVYWSANEYEDRIFSGKSEAFFLGWRSSLGDAGEFFTTVIHSKTKDGRYGALNPAPYSEDGLDYAVEQMDLELRTAVRLDRLQALMSRVVQQDIIGVPLFESDTLVAVQPNLIWDPRVDNFIVAADFR